MQRKLGRSRDYRWDIQPDGTRPIDTIDTINDRLITELLRVEGPAQVVVRTATYDHVLGGVTIRAGEPAVVVLAAANRDPAVFNKPDRDLFRVFLGR